MAKPCKAVSEMTTRGMLSPYATGGSNWVNRLTASPLYSGGSRWPGICGSGTRSGQSCGPVPRWRFCGRELPPMAIWNQSMHPVPQAMIAVADGALAFLALAEMHANDPHTIAVEGKAWAAEMEAVRVASKSMPHSA